MRRILLLIWILCLYGCNGQTKNGNSDNKSHGIVLKLKNTSIIIEEINTVNDVNNIKEDFIIQNSGAEILIQPAYLESDLLDGKTLRFLNDAVQNVKITFSYDAVFYGEDKEKTSLGFKRDTTMIFEVNDKKVNIPSFVNIEKSLIKKFEKNEVYSVAYLVNQNYFKNIIANSEDFGGTSSPDYKEAMIFFKKGKKDFKKLEELFINVDYSKFSIEFVDKNKAHSIIIYDRMFQTYEFSKVDESEDKSKIIVPKGFYILDSTMISLKNIKYKILTLEKDEIKNKDNAQHNSNPIVILKRTNNGYYKIMDNYNLVFKYDDNCPADGYGGIVVKNNYFTVQQIFCMDFMFVNSYTTFKIDENTNNLYLHNYGEEYTDRSNPDKKISVKTWSTKDFGVVNFEDVTEAFLDELRNKN
jgi:hypothetical protein